MVYSSFVMVFSMIFYYELYIYSSESEMGNLEQKNRQLTADAKEDVLTNLLNRRGFLPVVKEVMDNDKHIIFVLRFVILTILSALMIPTDTIAETRFCDTLQSC
jgi:hypothetical protein